MQTLARLTTHALVLLLVVPVPRATAQSVRLKPPEGFDGMALLRTCRTLLKNFEGLPYGTSQTAFDSGYCLGALISLIASTQVCLPQWTISAEQAVRIMLRYLETHPLSLHEPGHHLFVWAFREAFPCPPIGAPSPR